MSLRRRRFCVFRCDGLDEQGVPLHQFPNPNTRAELFAAWVSAVGDNLKENDPMRIVKNKQICDQHFEPSTKTCGGRLTSSAIPTINLHCIKQSITSIVETDHNYCGPRREHLLRLGAQIDVVNLTLPGPSSSGRRALMHITNQNLTDTLPIPSGSNSASTCLAVNEKYLSRSKRMKLNAESDNIILHSFPHPINDVDRFRTWIYAIAGDILALNNDVIFNKYKVCHCHFETKYYTASKRLSANAVPTLQLMGKVDTKYKSDVDADMVQNDHCDVKKILRVENTSGIKGEVELGGKASEDSQSVNCSKSANHSISANLSKSATDKSATAGVRDIDTLTAKEMATSSAEPLFSWQKSELIPADEPEAVELVCEDVPQDPSGDNVTSRGAPTARVSLLSEPVPREEYWCKECGESIKGFQFWCVQCLGCALCAACEAHGAHNAHYVLRAPPHRPHRQTQVVLAAIRHQLQNENMLTTPDTGDGSVKLEVKEEPIEEEVTMMTRDVPGPDPLAAPDPFDTSTSDDDDNESIHTEDNDDLEEITEPHPKRARLTNFIEQDFIVQEKPNVTEKKLPVKVTGTAPSQNIIDLDEFEDVQYLDEEYLDTEELANLETNIEELENLETNSNIMILGDADINVVIKRVNK